MGTTSEEPKDEVEHKIEFLPCLFQSNIDESHKSVYFDSIIKDADPKHFPKHKKDSKFCPQFLKV